jgi:hypothetical protein
VQAEVVQRPSIRVVLEDEVRHQTQTRARGDSGWASGAISKIDIRVWRCWRRGGCEWAADEIRENGAGRDTTYEGDDIVMSGVLAP